MTEQPNLAALLAVFALIITLLQPTSAPATPLTTNDYVVRFEDVPNMTDRFTITARILVQGALTPIPIDPLTVNTTSSTSPTFFVILPDGNFLYLNESNQFMDTWIPQKPAGVATFSLGTTQAYAADKNDPRKPPGVALWYNDGPILGSGEVTVSGNATPATSDYLDSETGPLKVGTSWAPWDHPTEVGEFYFLILTFTSSEAMNGQIAFSSCVVDSDPTGFKPVSYSGYNINQAGWSTGGFPAGFIVPLEGIPPGEVRHVYVRLERQTNQPAYNGLASYRAEVLKTQANGTLGPGFSTPTCAEYTLAGSPHDPNEKRVDQSRCTRNGVGWLRYWITFQNEGTGPARDVLVEDDFPATFEPSTFSLVEYSSVVAPTVSPAGLDTWNFGFRFNAIDLPGLAQKNRRYTYNETVGWFSFLIRATCSAQLSNAGKITFYGSDGTAQPPIGTEPAHTEPDDYARSRWPVVLPATASERPASLAGCDSALTLITNAGFQSGANGSFQSALPQQCGCAAGSYCVGNRFKSKCSSWPGTFDHSKGNSAGSFLLIDGHPSQPAMVWSDSVCVEYGRTYTFSFWFKSVAKTWNPQLSLGLVIRGTTATSITIAQPSLAWEQYEVKWTSTVSGCIPIGIKQMGGGGQHDFGLDDIFFGYCPAAVNN